MAHKLTLQQAQQVFTNKGATPLFTEYRGVMKKHEFVCRNKLCNNIHSMIFNNVKSGTSTPSCPDCSVKEKLNSQLSFFKTNVVPKFTDFDATLITSNYKNSYQKLEFRCKCGMSGFVTYHNLTVRKQIPRCKECQLKYSYKKGSNHHFWNSNLTKEARSNYRKGHYLWKTKVKRRDNYTCQLCGSKKDLTAHHLYNYADYPDRREDVSNGITICQEHHIEFHSKAFYGKKNNTLDQFIKYASKFDKVWNVN